MLIIGISGACRREELTFLDVKNITDKGPYIIIQIPDTKTNVRREFTISPGNFEGLDLLEIFRTYFVTLFVKRMQECCSTYIFIINNGIAGFHLFYFS
jgi:integrase